MAYWLRWDGPAATSEALVVGTDVMARKNITTAASTTSVEGSTHAAFNAFRLETVDLPPNQFRYYLASTTQAEVPFAGGSSGTLCLGGNIGRFTDQVKSTGAAGELKIWVDLTDIPGNPPSSVQPGETWNFQAWHRDGATSNFSLPLAVTVD